MPQIKRVLLKQLCDPAFRELERINRMLGGALNTQQDLIKTRLMKTIEEAYFIGRGSVITDLQEKFPSDIEMSRQYGNTGMIRSWLMEKLKNDFT